MQKRLRAVLHGIAVYKKNVFRILSLIPHFSGIIPFIINMLTQ